MLSSTSDLIAHSAIVGPLAYRRKILGVLGLANGPMSTPFSEKDLTVFKTIAEQSAFALYNEVIYLEAGRKKASGPRSRNCPRDPGNPAAVAPPAVKGYELSGINVPARQVSGDYYDYIRVDDHRVGVAIADVSGKGVPASLIMAMCRSVIRSEAVGKIFGRRSLAAREPTALSRHQGRHVYQHGVPDHRFGEQSRDAWRGRVTMLRSGSIARRTKASKNSPRRAWPWALTAEKSSIESPRTSPSSSRSMIACYSTLMEQRKPLMKRDWSLDCPGWCARCSPMLRKVHRASSSELTEEVKNFAGNFPQHDDITLIAIRKR